MTAYHRTMRHGPNEETRRLVAAGWLQMLAERYPGRRFRLVGEDEGPPREPLAGAGEVDRAAVRAPDDVRTLGDRAA